MAEYFDAQQADDRRDAITIKFKLLKIVIAIDVQIHLTAFDQFIKKREGQMIFANDGLEFLVDDELRRFIAAGAADVGTPFRQPFAALSDGRGFVVRRVIHFAAKSVERGHGVASGSWQHHKGQRQI